MKPFKEKLDKIALLMDSLKKTTDIYFYLDDVEFEEHRVLLEELNYPTDYEYHYLNDFLGIIPDFVKTDFEKNKHKEKTMKLRYKGFDVYFFCIL